MSDDPTLRERARAAIHSGRVPTVPPNRMLCGLAAGATCAVCGDRLAGDEVAFEFEYRTPPAEADSLTERRNWIPEVQRYHLHHDCFVAWEFERTNVGPPERRQSTTPYRGRI